MMPAAGAAVADVAVAERSGSSRSDCTDCSHCASRTSQRTRAGVRVSVNLGQFFSDQRARAFMWAPYGRCVQWLGRRVARVFGLPEDIALMSRGHMLPVIEPLLMLDRDDPVEVVNMSYVFTAHENHTEPNTSSQRTAGDPGNSRGVAPGAPGRAAAAAARSSNVIIKQESGGQMPSSSQGDTLRANLNISGVNLTYDAETTTEALGSPSFDDTENLQRLKRRALQLLDEHCHVLHEASAPKRLRRRRRRRRPQALGGALDASDDDEPRFGGTGGEAEGGAVMRNGSGSRPPRIVRALSPTAPPVLQYVL